jgi:hypothetical protein
LLTFASLSLRHELFLSAITFCTILLIFLLDYITSGSDGERDDGFQPLTTRHPLLTQVEAPALKNYGTTFFEKFMAKRELYDANLAQQNASDPSVEFVANPLKNYIENDVLECICDYDLDCTGDSVTDEQLIEYFARTSTWVVRRLSI